MVLSDGTGCPGQGTASFPEVLRQEDHHTSGWYREWVQSVVRKTERTLRFVNKKFNFLMFVRRFQVVVIKLVFKCTESSLPRTIAFIDPVPK